VLGDPAPAQTVLVDTLFQTIGLNLLVTWPIYSLVRRLLPPAERPERVQGVELLG
jgi:hypothetical protein